MFKEEGLFQKEADIAPQYIETSCGPIPFKWYFHPKVQRAALMYVPQMETGLSKEVSREVLPQLVPGMLSEPGILDQTIKSLNQDQEVEIHGVKGMHLQAGVKAFILMCEANTSAGPSHFAIYLSRGGENSFLGNEAIEDFYNLKALSRSADARLKDEAKEKYRFMMPIALGLSPEINGERYPFFTMPFVRDYGEMRADAFVDGETGLSFAYFRFPLTYNRAMIDYNRRAEKNCAALKRKFKRKQRRLRGVPLDEIAQHLHRSPQAKLLLGQFEDVLVGNALIYELSGGFFPSEFQINSGDWMMQPTQQDRLNLYLITIRGGWLQLDSDEDWVRRMEEHHEPLPGMENNISFPLFYGLGDLVPESLEKARQLID